MKTLKKTLCLVLAVVMAVGVLILPASAADKDTGKADYYRLANYGIFKGRDTGDALEAGVRRDEVATIAYRLMTGDIEGKYQNDVAVAANNFVDSNTFGDWNRGPIGYGYSHGLIAGRGNGKFDPADSVTGYELLAIMLRALGYDNNRTPKELQGNGWTDRVFKYANQQSLLKGLENEDLAVPIARRLVAKIVANVVDHGKMVKYSEIEKNYIVTNTSLVVLDKPLTSGDVFGIPTTTYSATYNYPATPTRSSNNPIGGKVLAEYWTPVTECDIADDIGLAADKTYTTYTNGIGNVGSRKIEPTDLVNTVGHQGRHTIIYDDNGDGRIVYIDTFLAKVTGWTDEVKDPAGHVIVAKSATLTIYCNSVAGNNGTVATAQPMTCTVKGVNADGLTPNGFVYCNVETQTADNTLPSTIDVKKVHNITPITPVTVTVASVVRDSNNNNTNATATPNALTEVGFVGTNGTRYLYNYTYGYNNGQSVQRVLTTDVGKTYSVYLDSKGNILGLAPVSTTSNNFGVLLAAGAVNISKGVYGIEMDILTPDGTTTTIVSLGEGYTTSAAAEARASQIMDNGHSGHSDDGILVYYYSTGNGYYDVITAGMNYKSDTDGIPAGIFGAIGSTGVWPQSSGNTVNVIQRGEADTLKQVGNSNVNPASRINNISYIGAVDGIDDLVVDDTTVFFVANYSYVNSRQTYAFSKFVIYKGFKNIYDLAYVNDPAEAATINGKAVTGLEVSAFDSDSDGHADYVLVLNANRQYVPEKVKVPNFAFLMANPLFVNSGDDYHIFGAIKNGVDGQQVQITTGDEASKVINTGLYIYRDETVNGWSHVEYVSGNGTCPTATKTTPDYSIDAGTVNTWRVKDGVLIVQPTTTTSVSDSWDTTNDKYLTLADDVQVYIVNPTKGTSFHETRYPLTRLDDTDVYGNYAICYQYDEDGYVDLIYIVAQKAYNNDEVLPTNPHAGNVNVHLVIKSHSGSIIYDKTSTSVSVAAGAQTYTVAADVLVQVYFPTVEVSNLNLIEASVPETVVAGKNYTIELVYIAKG